MQVVREELADDPTIDITTIGRRSGLPRRVEIWMMDVDGRFFITGTPGRRDVASCGVMSSVGTDGDPRSRIALGRRSSQVPRPERSPMVVAALLPSTTYCTPESTARKVPR